MIELTLYVKNADRLLPCKLESKLTDGQCVIALSSDEYGDFCVESTDFFSALLLLRRELEALDVLILCAGSQLNVHPSRMAMDMGRGRRAYVTAFGKKAKMDDLVDIFLPIDKDCVATIVEQEKHYKDWIASPIVP